MYLKGTHNTYLNSVLLSVEINVVVDAYHKCKIIVVNITMLDWILIKTEGFINGVMFTYEEVKNDVVCGKFKLFLLPDVKNVV